MRMGPILQSMARTSCVLLGVTMMGGCEVKRASSVGLSEWERVKRVTVHNSPRRSRYPSIARAGDGALLVLFMRQTAEQEAAGQGDLGFGEVETSQVGQSSWWYSDHLRGIGYLQGMTKLATLYIVQITIRLVEYLPNIVVVELAKQPVPRNV